MKYISMMILLVCMSTICLAAKENILVVNLMDETVYLYNTKSASTKPVLKGKVGITEADIWYKNNILAEVHLGFLFRRPVGDFGWHRIDLGSVLTTKADFIEKKSF